MSDGPPIPTHEEILNLVRDYRNPRSYRPSASELEPVGPGEMSVWDFPRPPEVREVFDRVRVEWCGHTVADSDKARMIVETSGAPVIYFHADYCNLPLIFHSGYVTLCEWKGAAVHFDLVDGEHVSERAAFYYPDPLTDLGQGYEKIAKWIAFYPSRVDACWWGEDRVTPQEGGFYAGWVTPKIKGPIKGAPGTQSW